MYCMMEQLSFNETSPQTVSALNQETNEISLSPRQTEQTSHLLIRNVQTRPLMVLNNLSYTLLRGLLDPQLLPPDLHLQLEIQTSIFHTLSFVVHEVLFGFGPSLLAFNFFSSSYCIFLMRGCLDGLDLACPQMMIDRSSVSMRGVWYIIIKCVFRAIIITLSSPAAGGS